MQSWAVRCAIQDQTFMLENMNDAFGYGFHRLNGEKRP
jgi:hypothetical protein